MPDQQPHREAEHDGRAERGDKHRQRGVPEGLMVVSWDGSRAADRWRRRRGTAVSRASKPGDSGNTHRHADLLALWLCGAVPHEVLAPETRLDRAEDLAQLGWNRIEICAAAGLRKRLHARRRKVGWQLTIEGSVMDSHDEDPNVCRRCIRPDRLRCERGI